MSLPPSQHLTDVYRGIPSGYISSLEKRLAETEVALYGALRDGRNVDPRQSEDLIARLEEHNASQTRASKQAAWARGPVTDNDGQQQWTREISRILDDDAQTAHGIRDAAPVDGSTDRLTPVSVLEARPRAQSAHFAGTESAGKVLDSRTPASSSLREEGMPSPLKRAKTERVANDAARSEVGVMRRSRANNAASFVGSASGIQFVRAVYNAMARASHGNPTSYAQVTDGVPAEDDHLSGPDVRCLWQEHELSSGFNIVPGDMGPSLLNDLFTWSQSYFDQWHPAYPFLEAADVRGWFGQLACGMAISEDDRLARHRMVVVRSIMSIALADRRQADSLGVGRQVPAELVFDSFGTALGSVQSALVEPPSLEALQAVLSVQLFLVTMLRHNAASRLGGLVTRMIFQMGLHRCPARYATFSVTEISLRQRIFYAAYCIDRHICQSLGLPLTLRDDDIDVCRCGSEKHPSETIDQSESSEAYSLPDFLARHGEIVGLVMELRNKSISHRQADREQATLLSTKIAKWSNDVDGFLESEEAYTMTSFHHTVLTVLKGESVIALNRPLLATKVKPEYDSALHSCISASRSIISTLHKYMFRTLARTDDSQTPVMPLAWPSFTWSVWMSAFIALYATLENEMYRTVAAR